MKKTVMKVVSIIMFLVTISAVICVISLTGEGFLDLSNLGRFFLILLAIVSGIIGVITAKYGWKSAR